MERTGNDGDQLFGTFVGQAVPDGAAVDFWGDFTITGGSGRFVGATATGTYSGTAEGTPFISRVGGPASCATWAGTEPKAPSSR